MPQKSKIRRAKKQAKQGKTPSTQAGEFVRKVIHAIRQGKHGARSSKQAIAIGLSEARRAGVKVPKPASATKKAKASTRKPRVSASAKKATTSRRSKATLQALKREPRSSASYSALSQHARQAAKKRTHASRRAAALKAARTRKRNAAYEARV